MELSERKKTIIIVTVLVVVALVSILWIGSVASSEESFVGTYKSLDDKRTTVMELMAAAAATSTAISLIPGDGGTPMAEQFADLSGYFMFILAAIFVEKWMVTVTGFLAFRILIPVGCLILIIARVFSQEQIINTGVKLILFALMVFAIIPVSGMVTDRIDASYQESVRQAIEDSRKGSQEIKEKAGDNEDQNLVEKWLGKVKGGVSGQLEKFEDLLNRFTEAIAVMIVTSCAIPLAVMIFFIWLIKLLTGVEIKLPKTKMSRMIGRK